MIGRRLLLLVPVLFVGTIGLRPAWGAKLTKDVRESTNAAAVKSKIQELVDAAVTGLSGTDPAAQHDAREGLIAEVQTSGANPATPSPAFLDAYADVLNTSLAPLLKNPSAAIRLEVGIVAARVAEKAGNTRLMPLVVALLNDSQPPVVYWGVKATKYLLVPALTGPGAKNNPLVPAFQEAVKKNITVGPMVQAAYDAFRAGDPAAAQPTIVAMVQSLQTIMALRRDEFAKGVPDMPSSETAAMTFLTDDKVWKAQSPALQLQTMQLISDIVYLAGQHIVAAQPAERNELVDLLKKTGSALRVIALQQPKIDPVAKGLYSINAIGPTDKMADATKAVYPALKEVWKDLKPPPEPQPTTAP